MGKRIKLWSMIAGTIVCFLTSFGSEKSVVSNDVPVVSNVQMTQEKGTRRVTISYDITESPGIVTLDIQTNGVSIGEENFRNAVGDLNKVVGIGPHVITWQPERSWQGHKVTNATAKVSAWSKADPPNYMAVRLSPAAEDNIRWYVSETALPRGIDDDLYRGDVLLMRRIFQPIDGEWVMGSPDKEPNHKSNERLHLVTLTKGYWIGVFPITQRQWELILGENPSHFKGDFRPVAATCYNMIRGQSESSYYPNEPHPDSFLGKLRAITNLPFDIPSEMQWEYACRAGTSTAFNNGKNSGLSELGRYFDNGGGSNQHCRVGSYKPNAWGLYDMHGNVYEWCLDWYADNIVGLKGQVNTITPPNQDTAKRVLRGGAWQSTGLNCRSAFRHSHSPSTVHINFGLRVVCSE